MLRAEDNKFLTESGAGTGMGELLRRFWIPVLLSEELPEVDGEPKKIVVIRITAPAISSQNVNDSIRGNAIRLDPIIRGTSQLANGPRIPEVMIPIIIAPCMPTSVRY